MQQQSLSLDLCLHRAPDDLDRLAPMVLTAEKRPVRQQPLVLRTAALSVLRPVLGWLSQEGDLVREDEIDQIVEQLTAAAEAEDDGYQMARYLERRHGWPADSQLTEILNDLPYQVSRAHDRLVRLWVKLHDIRPSHDLGDIVHIRTWNKEGRIEKVRGEIISIKTDQAKYLINCPSLGHVTEGTGCHGIYVNYESINP